MRVVMTLMVRDEVDVVREHLTFHLNAGVDFVVVTDNGSVDGTSEILAEFEKAGLARVLYEPVGEFRQREWQSRMARLAATDHGADWVVNSDADEFWWPRGGSFHEVLGEIPGRYGIVQSFFRHFVPVAEDGRAWPERMVYRLNPQAPVNDPLSPWRPFRKVVHRADPRVTVVEGSHDIRDTELRTMRGWYPVECLHVPMRSAAQVERKGMAWAGAVTKFYAGDTTARAAGAAYHALQHQAAERGESGAYFDSLALDQQAAAAGLRDGVLVADTRIRDAVAALAELDVLQGSPSPLRFERPTTLETVAFALDGAVLAEADVIRTQRWLEDLEGRVGVLERTLPARVERRLRTLLRREG